jgi:hypothetical protein
MVINFLSAGPEGVATTIMAHWSSHTTGDMTVVQETNNSYLPSVRAFIWDLVFIESRLLLLQTEPWLLRHSQDGCISLNVRAEKLYEQENFPELLINVPRNCCLCPVSCNFCSVDHTSSKRLITHIKFLPIFPLLISCNEFAVTPMTAPVDVSITRAVYQEHKWNNCRDYTRIMKYNLAITCGSYCFRIHC